MSKRSARRVRIPESVELDITAFMNLMVILVPFLLITTVFTHLTVLDINLPTTSQTSSTPSKKKKTFEINVIMGKKHFIVADNNSTNWNFLFFICYLSLFYSLLHEMVIRINAQGHFI